VADQDLRRTFAGVDPRGVHERRAPHGPDHRAGHDQQRRHLDVGVVRRRLQPLDQLHGAAGIHIRPHRNVRRGLGAEHHPGRHRLAHPFDRDRLLAGLVGHLLRDRDGLLADFGPFRGADVAEDAGLRGVLQHVVPGDLAGRTGRGDMRQVHTEVTGELADGWLRDHADGRRDGSGGGGPTPGGHRARSSVPHQHRPGRLGFGRCDGGVGGVVSARVGDHHDGRPHLDGVALGNQELRHPPRERRGQLHKGLGCLDLHQHVIDGHLVARPDPPGDDLRLRQALTDIGEVKGAAAHEDSSGGVSRPGPGRPPRGSGRGRAGRDSRRWRGGTGCRSPRPEGPERSANRTRSR